MAAPSLMASLPFLALVLLAILLRHTVFRAERTNEGWCLALCVSFLALALASLVLVRAGSYSPAAAGAVLLLAGGAITLRWRPGRALAAEPREAWLIATLVVAISVFNALFPTWYLLGGRDSGLYLLFSVHSARTGGLDLDLPVLRELYARFGSSIRLGYPGIYSAFERGLSDDPAKLIPQFMHLFPAVAANFFALSGMEGLVRANAVIGGLALWTFFTFTRRLLPLRPSLLATAALGINPAVIWTARSTLTEMLSILILFLGLLLCNVAAERASPRWGAAAGLILGLGVLNRLDAALSVLAILGLSVHALLDDKPEGRRRLVTATVAAAAYLAGSTLGFLDGYLHSLPYLMDQYRQEALGKLLAMNYAGGLLALAPALLPLKVLERLRGQAARGQRLLVACSAAVVLWTLFAYGVRPSLETGFNGHALRELGWYVTPPVILLFCVGFVLSARGPVWRAWLPALLTAGMTFFIYTWKPSITPDHIWASRRWVPALIPLMTLLAALALAWLHEHRRTWRRVPLFLAAPLAMGYYVSSCYEFSRPFLFRSMLEGSGAGYEALARHLSHPSRPPPYLSNEGWVASILTYVYDVPAVLVRGDAPLLHGTFNGYRLIGMPLSSSLGTPEHQGRMSGPFLERSVGERPRRLFDLSYPLNTGVLKAAAPR